MSPAERFAAQIEAIRRAEKRYQEIRDAETLDYFIGTIFVR